MGERGRLAAGAHLVSSILEDSGSIIHNETCLPAFLADLYTVQLFYLVESGDPLVINDTQLSCPARTALAIREAAVVAGTMDPFHPNRANGFMNVGVMMTQSNPCGAVEMHRKALEIRLGSTKYTEDQVHGLALNYLNIGRALWLAKRHDDAVEALKKCIVIMDDKERLTSKRFPQ